MVGLAIIAGSLGFGFLGWKFNSWQCFCVACLFGFAAVVYSGIPN